MGYGQRLWSKIDVGGDEECWEWRGTISQMGYGQFFIKKVNGRPLLKLAHRVVYEEIVGPIPAGKVVCHKCDNPKCVNPLHMFVGTMKQNSEDMARKGRSTHGEKNPMAKLTEKEVSEIRKRFVPYDRHNGSIALAREFGVTRHTVYKITSRQHWVRV